MLIISSSGRNSRDFYRIVTICRNISYIWSVGLRHPALNMTTLRHISAAIVLLLIPALSAHINAQDIKPDFAVGTPLPEGLFNPTAPDVSAMMRYGGRTGTSLYTGAAHLSIPVFDYEDADISLPISMEYDCNGYKPGVTASTLGYGWTLSAGGAITREVHGLPDEVRQREYGARNTGDNSAIEDLIHTAELSMVDAGTTRHLVQTYMKGQTVLIDGYASRYASDMALGGTDFAYSGELGREYVLYRKYDGQTRMGVEEEPDTYHFQFLGHSGSFTLGDNGQVVILESSTPAGELAISMHYNRNEPGTSSFTITTGEGTKYYFEYRDNCHAALDGADAGGFTVIYARVPSPSMDRNWILTERLSGSQSKAYSIDYFDGVGNLVQSQEVFASEDGGADLITAHSFDHLFRETRTYSPYPLPDNYGAFDPSAEARQEAFYKGLYPQESGNGAYAWTETAHDAAPGGRVTSLTRPGKVYHEVGRSLRTAYRGNRAGEVLIVDVGVSDGALSIPGYYLQGSLACVSATDEDGRRKDTFTDLDGNVVLERRFPVEGDSTLVADTYYGYDVMGRLRIVIMPEASALLSEDGDIPDLDGLCYRYEYDSRGRICQATTPGAEPVFLVHDKADRTVMRQDGNMRAKGQWLLMRYDGAGRLTSQELASAGTALTRDSLQAVFDSGSVPEVYSGSPATKLIEIAYGRYPSAMDEDLAFRGVEGITALAGASFMRTDVTGLAVSERVRVLGYDEFVLRAFYYDALENLIQTVEKRPDGSILTTSRSFDLQGRILRRRAEWRSGSATHTLDETMEYDDRGTLLGTTSMLDGHEAATRLSYDSLGRLSRTDYGKGSGMVSETRGWNLQGWETSRAASSRGSSIFSSVIRYDGSWNGSAGLFSGGISSWTWHHAGSSARSYVFSYDGMGRLTGAEQFDGTVKTNAHTERDIAYDLNSAILSMKRSNGSAAQTFSRSYDGVRRSGLDYDANGNVTRDPGNRFSASYNILNLPETVRAEGYLDCEIVYLADGTKIRAIETQDMQAGYYYAGPFRMSYSDGAIDLESAAFSGGRFDFSGTPHYFLSDHLGSVRAIVDADGEAEAAYDYLPYGGLWSSSGTDYDNDFLFGGKERKGRQSLAWTFTTTPHASSPRTALSSPSTLGPPATRTSTPTPTAPPTRSI